MTPYYPVDIVIFDCDSTLSTIEGIDELAQRAGVYDQLAPLTSAAMEGKLKLEQIYKQRLDIIKPTCGDIEWLGQRYLETIVADADTVVNALLLAGKQVHIVSGGIRQAVARLAVKLNIPDEHVHAVEIRFNSSDEYDGYDETSPLTRSYGKKTVSRKIIGNYHTAVMVGDGITDLEVAQNRIHFVGFGGVVRRQHIENNVADYIADATLEPLLDRLLPRYKPATHKII